MPHKLRKIRKMRGSRTHGYGRVGQHRCHGQKRTRPLTYVGKHGFTSPASLRPMPSILNVGSLDALAEEISTKKNNKFLVDLNTLGYDKLLGKGQLTKPLIIKVSSFSKFAAAKIKKAGGEIMTS